MKLKNILLGLVFGVISLTSFAQQLAPKGIIVGTGNDTITEIKTVNDSVVFYKGSVVMPFKGATNISATQLHDTANILRLEWPFDIHDSIGSVRNDITDTLNTRGFASQSALNDTAGTIRSDISTDIAAHNTNDFTFPNGIKVGGGDTIQTIYIRDDTLFFVTSRGNYYAELASYSGEVGNPNRIYVSTGGSDSNDGRDSLHPVQSLSYAQSLASAGDTICLKRGDSWSITNVFEVTQSGVSGNPIVWDGLMWGTGDTATIEAAIDGGSSPVYYTTWRFVNCSYVTVENLVFDGGGYERYGVVVGGDASYNGPTAQNNEHDIIIQNCEIKDFGSGSAYQIAMLIRPDVTDIHNITIADNTIHGSGGHCVALYPTGSDYSSTGIPKKNYDIIISGNTIYNPRLYTNNTGTGIMVINWNEDVTIEHNTISFTDANTTKNPVCLIAIDRNDNYSSYDLPADNIVIRYNNLEYTKTSGAIPVIYFLNSSSQAVTQNVKIYGNLIYNSLNSSGAMALQISSSNSSAGWNIASTIEIYNNTIITTSTSQTINIYMNNDDQIVLKNNIIYNSYNGGDFDGICVNNHSSTYNLSHSNNLYYKPNTAYLVADNGGNYYKASNIIGSYESTAVTTDPTFVTNFTDLHLQTGSPADGAGIAISGIILDYDGVTYDDPPAIGAYEKK